MGYVPDGLTEAQWKALQAKERKKQQGLGASGTNRFQSRSMYSFMKDKEAGKVTNLCAGGARGTFLFVREGRMVTGFPPSVGSRSTRRR